MDKQPTGERLDRAKLLLCDAMEKSKDEAIAWVREQAGDDAALADYVIDLLQGEDETRVIEDGVRRAATEFVHSQRPTQIGRYRILETLGEGGMGTVYLAEQTEPLQRRVALKLVKLGMDSAAVVARFEHERQSLAMMEHDGIAKVHDCGTSERGQPFFVMELVRGTPIADYCDDRNLSLRERIELLQQVCDAVQHAHQKGVVHRDLKPSNVLVVEADGRAQVKVIDFGLAKAMRTDLEATPLLTDPGQIVGTVEYMSPEQADPSNSDIDTRADVYSLGVMLYELLVGSLPFADTELRGAGLLELQRLMRDVEPARPSQRYESTDHGGRELAAQQRRSSPSVLLRQLREDLDWIVLRAMAKDRKERYESASALAADLQRFLDHEPVLAGPPSAGYRLSKFVRRYRSQVFAAASVLTTAVVGAIVAVFFAILSDKNAVLFANKVREFDLLSGVVLHDRVQASFAELQPAWPEMIPAMDGWLRDDYDELLQMLPEIQRTIADLRVRAMPRSPEQLQDDLRAHPKWSEFAQIRGWVAAEQRARQVRAGGAFERPEPSEEVRAMEVSALLGGILPRIAANPHERKIPDEERLGLSYALALLEKTRDTAVEGQAHMLLAFAYRAHGLDDDTLRHLDLAVERAPERMRQGIKGASDLLRSRMNEDDSELHQFELRLVALQSEVEMAYDYEFQLESHEFLHRALIELRTDIAQLAMTEVPTLKARLKWAHSVAELTRAHRNARVTWDEVRAAIAKADGIVASELYRDQNIELADEDVMGLVPIGMNPKTKFWEFYHLSSSELLADRHDVPIPAHRPDGSIDIGDSTGMVFVLVPGGSFAMGAQSSEPTAENYEDDAQWYVGPVHDVTLEPFFLSRYELTIKQWQRLWQGSDDMVFPSHYRLGAFLPKPKEMITGDHPVNQVDWHQASDLLALYGLVLPTEAQWEYACRAGTTTPWFCDESELFEYANLADARARLVEAEWAAFEEWEDGYAVSAPVDHMKPNPWGFYHMIGNVCEWCQDPLLRYDVPVREGDGLRTRPGFDKKVVRGGSMAHRAAMSKSSMRTPAATTQSLGHFGVRPARPLRPRR